MKCDARRTVLLKKKKYKYWIGSFKNLLFLYSFLYLLSLEKMEASLDQMMASQPYPSQDEQLLFCKKKPPFHPFFILKKKTLQQKDMLETDSNVAYCIWFKLFDQKTAWWNLITDCLSLQRSGSRHGLLIKYWLGMPFVVFLDWSIINNR